MFSPPPPPAAPVLPGPAELDYFATQDEPPEEKTGFQRGRALWGLLLSLGATCTAIGVALLEPAPVVRQLILVGVAMFGGTGICEALIALRDPRSAIDQTLVIAGMSLGGLAVGAAVVLF